MAAPVGGGSRSLARGGRARAAPMCVGLASLVALLFIASSFNLTHMRQAIAPVETTLSRRISAREQEAPAEARLGIVRSDSSSTVTPSPTQRQAENGGGAADDELAGCLITKWQSIWLVHLNKTRSHVTSPSHDCADRASEIVDATLDNYPKAHGGEGLYSLTPSQSAKACTRQPCFGRAVQKAEGAGATGEGMRVPPNGWGMGIAHEWTSLVNLKFNQVHLH